MKVFKTVCEWRGQLWSWCIDNHGNDERAQAQINNGEVVEYVKGQPARPMPGCQPLYATTNLKEAKWYAEGDDTAEIWEAEAEVAGLEGGDIVRCHSITLIKPYSP